MAVGQGVPGMHIGIGPGPSVETRVAPVTWTTATARMTRQTVFFI